MAGELKNGTSVIGVGLTRFGDLLETPEIKGLTLQELAAQAAFEAMDDANVEPKEIDAVLYGNAMVYTSNLPATYSQISKWIGMDLKPGIHFETQCSTTNTGMCLAAMGVASGVYDKVLVVGVEATRNKVKGLSHPYEREAIPPETTWLWTDYAVNQAYSVPQGYDIFSTYNGIVAQGYARKYGLSIDQLDEVMFEICRTRRMHGALNPKAFIQKRIEDEAKEHGFDNAWEFWRSRYNPFVGWPIRVRSLVTPADGASAIVMCRADEAGRYTDTPIDLKGFYFCGGDNPWYTADPTLFPADKIAFRKAYRMARIEPHDIDYLHVHDCSHICNVVLSEEAGYFPKGGGWKAALEHRTDFNGDKPMTTGGGRHALGHAWAASAGSETYEAVKQMRGECGKRQIWPEPEVSVVHTHGYSMIGTVCVLRRR